MSEEIINDKTLLVYGKRDIMKVFGCESDKALKILNTIYQLKMGIKIDKEYYVERDNLHQFLEAYKGQEILI